MSILTQILPHDNVYDRLLGIHGAMVTDDHSGMAPASDELSTFYRRTINIEVFKYFQEMMHGFQAYPVYSSAWLEKYNICSQRYHEFETLRLQLEHDRGTWQDEFEGDLHLLESLGRRHVTFTMDEEEWKECPLGAVLGRYLGRDREIPRETTDMMTALLDFEAVKALVFGPTPDDVFVKYLSRPQRVSLNLLNDWWNSNYQDKSLTNSAIESIRTVASFDCTQGVDKFRPELERGAKISESLYHGYLFFLFRQEFNPMYWDYNLKNTFLVRLRLLRIRTLSIANSQRIAYVALGAELHKKGKVEPPAFSAPYTGSIFKPCPWLESQFSKTEQPLYLWDRESGCTVKSATLADSPKYICISHTWGRWRKAKIKIPGVPWLVPQNQKFEVAEIPQHFRSLQFAERFIWFDLFCIPQDESREADEEISRQAVIFRQASACMAWIHDVQSWEGTSSALNWLGFAFLDNTTQLCWEKFEGMKADAKERADQLSELLPGYSPLGPRANDVPKESQKIGPNVWFSSLWTLQEAALCPDLLLLDRNWKPLTDAAGVHLGLSTLLGFVDTVADTWMEGKRPDASQLANPDIFMNKLRTSPIWDSHAPDRWPTSAESLRRLSVITRLDSALRVPTPTGLFIMANLRQCSDERAPAIMSALGVTDWYQNDVIQKRKKCNKKKVLDAYPLSFVREAAHKFGAAFYGSWSPIAREIPVKWNPEGLRGAGSMLPFTRPKDKLYHGIGGVPENSPFNIVDHPSVKTWVINADGSVRMRSAGIIAAKGQSKNIPYEATVMMMYCDGSYSPHPYIYDLDNLVQHLPNSEAVYAISLYGDANYQHGIILQGSKAFWSSVSWLVKTGVFYAYNKEMQPAEAVNWIVV
ncbi:hypothetical protein BP5796_12275 [Coleophoma crateriformis]|uniref:Heterokaryon incompatibility domain-containing protein n=1 Tax=Coleophoma crateriformis TaxID=565419 RepID=A0A3D8Q934_9HELO|nr:hypothetical protein BP5796_12275 [Coleophoma crateriformis]